MKYRAAHPFRAEVWKPDRRGGWFSETTLRIRSGAVLDEIPEIPNRERHGHQS